MIQKIETYTFPRGIHPREGKEFSEKQSIEILPVPTELRLPLSQHIGAPAKLCVAMNDTLEYGQRVAEAGGFVSAPVYASLPGKVKRINFVTMPNGRRVESVLLAVNPEGFDTQALFDRMLHLKEYKLADFSPEEILKKISNAGLVGQGGAAFPTHVKFTRNAEKPVDTLLLNGCECEPLITADHKVLLEYPDEILFGLRAIMKATGAGTGIIVIEDNKPDAIELLSQKAEDFENISVAAVRTKYPQGAEKMLIKRVLGRQVPSGGLPADVGAIVCNVSTAKAISDAITLGMPLVERVVSVTGERKKSPETTL